MYGCNNCAADIQPDEIGSDGKLVRHAIISPDSGAMYCSDECFNESEVQNGC